MKNFIRLFHELDDTRSTQDQLAALVRYFSLIDPADAAWAVWLLTGRRTKGWVSPRALQDALVHMSAYPEWLVDDCLAAVGDLADTIALLLDETARPGERPGLSLQAWMESRFVPLRDLPPAGQREAIEGSWWEWSPPEILIVTRLLTGGLDVGVSRRLVSQALADVNHLPARVVARRLTGQWTPTTDFYETLIGPVGESGETGESS